MPKEQPQHPVPRRWQRLLLLSLLYGTLVCALVGCGMFGVFTGSLIGLSKDSKIWTKQDFDEEFESWAQPSTAYFAPPTPGADPILIGELISPEHREMLRSMDEIPENVHLAILSTEDRNFYEHGGFAFSGIGKAALQYITNTLTSSSATGPGGSTVTQQVVKNTILKDRTRSLQRKALEIIYATRLERCYPKEDILRLYCNSVYLGKNLANKQIVGFAAGAKDIFDTPLANLPLAPAAYLVGMVQSPNDYNPLNGSDENLQRGLRRMRQVLFAMLDNRAITEQQYHEALQFDIAAHFQTRATVSSMETYPFVISAVQKEAAQILESLPETNHLTAQERRQRVNEGGLRIYTSLDKNLYDAFQQDAQNFPSNKAELNDRTIQDKLGAVLLANKTGEILAFATSNLYKTDQQNYALAVQRQPGSSMKVPLGYGPAIEEQLITSHSYLDDRPLPKSDGSGTYGNADKQYKGSVSAVQALRESRNIPAILVFRMLGKERANSYLQKMGMSLSKQDGEASILGGLRHGFTVREMTGAYGMVANQGIFHRPHLIQRIVDTHERELFRADRDIPEVEVFSRRTTSQLHEMMQSVVHNPHGTAYNLIGKRFPQYPLVGKTGTTSGDIDSWFIGCTPEVTLGVWSGFPYHIAGDKHRAQAAFARLFSTLLAQRPELAGQPKAMTPEELALLNDDPPAAP